MEKLEVLGFQACVEMNLSASVRPWVKVKVRVRERRVKKRCWMGWTLHLTGPQENGRNGREGATSWTITGAARRVSIYPVLARLSVSAADSVFLFLRRRYLLDVVSVGVISYLLVQKCNILLPLCFRSRWQFGMWIRVTRYAEAQ